jgi:hypothetical protein
MSRTRWVIAALLAACLLAGCGDGDPKPDIPKTTPSGSSSPTAASSSPTSSPTSLSTNPRASVDAWLRAWTVALQTGDVVEVQELSSPDCESCRRLISRVTSLYRDGGKLETDGWVASNVGEAPDSVEKTPSFVMQVHQGHQILFDETGSVVHDTPKMKVPMRMTFALAGGAWVLRRLEILE